MARDEPATIRHAHVVGPSLPSDLTVLAAGNYNDTFTQLFRHCPPLPRIVVIPIKRLLHPIERSPARTTRNNHWSAGQASQSHSGSRLCAQTILPYFFGGASATTRLIQPTPDNNIPIARVETYSTVIVAHIQPIQ